MIEGLVDRAWSCFQRLSGGDEAKKPDVYSNHQSEGTGWPPSHFYKGFDKNQIISSKSSFDGRTAFSLKEDIHQSEMGTFCSRNSFPLMDNHFLDQAFQHLLVSESRRNQERLHGRKYKINEPKNRNQFRCRRGFILCHFPLLVMVKPKHSLTKAIHKQSDLFFLNTVIRK